MGGGGGLAGMMSQLMQSPAMQQMAGSLGERANTRSGPAQRAAPDFGTFLQDMMPMVGQVQILPWPSRMTALRQPCYMLHEQ